MHTRRLPYFFGLFLGLLAPLSSGVAQTLTPLNYSLSVNGPVGYYGYDDNSYTATSLGNPVTGALSGGLGDLTNGQFGMTVGGGYWNWSPYVLWDGVRPQITFDFGSRQVFTDLTLHGISYAVAAVNSVSGLTLRASDDGMDWSAAQVYAFSDYVGNDLLYTLQTGALSGLSGRYLEVSLQEGNYRRWIAVSEISVSGVSAVPEPSTWALLTGALALACCIVRRPARIRTKPTAGA